jgi:hypothetical protein
MKSIVAGVVVVLGSTACATTSSANPAGYPGPVATIEDSFTQDSGSSRADFFVLYRLDGRDIDNALVDTVTQNEGRGLAMKPIGRQRLVPARQARFYLLGRSHYAAPIQELAGKAYLIAGEISFVPVAGARYVVKGSLTADRSSIWLEDASTGQRAGDLLAIEGSAEAVWYRKRTPVQHIAVAASGS